MHIRYLLCQVQFVTWGADIGRLGIWSEWPTPTRHPPETSHGPCAVIQQASRQKHGEGAKPRAYTDQEHFDKHAHGSKHKLTSGEAKRPRVGVREVEWEIGGSGLDPSG